MTLELELATTEDIFQELVKRNLRFIFAAVESGNTRRKKAAWFVFHGTASEELEVLWEAAADELEQFRQDETGDTGPR